MYSEAVGSQNGCEFTSMASKNRLVFPTSRMLYHNDNYKKKGSFVSITLSIRLCLFCLLIAQCIESNPGPTGAGPPVKARGGKQQTPCSSLEGNSRDRRSTRQSDVFNSETSQYENYESDHSQTDIMNDELSTKDDRSLLLEICREVKRTNKELGSLKQSVDALKADNKMLKDENKR